MSYFAINWKTNEVVTTKTRTQMNALGNEHVHYDSVETLANDPNATLSAMTLLWNKLNPSATIKRFSDRASGAKRIYEHVQKVSSQTLPTVPDEPKPEPKKEPVKAKRGRSGSRSKRLVPTVDRNPFREGTLSWRTWEMIVAEPGKTYEYYLGMGARANTINGALRSGELKAQD